MGIHQLQVNVMRDFVYDLQLHHGECLDVMATLPDGCVDMVLCDLPYGTTQNKWDSVIPLDHLWREYRRVCKGAIVLTATQPFSSALVVSNLKIFKYEWVWRKSRVTGVLNAKRQPLRCHESVLVFCEGAPPYNAQGLQHKGTLTQQGGSSSNYGSRSSVDYVQEFTNWPRSVLDIPSVGGTVHPTQKPVALMEYMVKTYTNPGDVVLDNTMGSGTTGVACMNTGRGFIGIELDDEYFQIAKSRIEAAIPIPEWLK